MPIQLPLEVIHLIILYIPTTNLRLLCEEDDSLKPLIAPILYKYVSVHCWSNVSEYPGHGYRTTEFHNITLLELNELVSGSIDAKIQHLKIRDCNGHVIHKTWNSEYFKKFWKLVKDSSEFFLKIPIIDFEGDDDTVTNCMEFLPTQNIRHLSIDYGNYNFQIDAFLPNITDLTIDAGHITNIPRLPKSLKHMVVRVSDEDETNLVFEFPSHLELFSIWNPFSGKLPEGLLKLETKDIHNMKLPDSLIDLSLIGPTDSLVTFPPGLKKLTFNSESMSSWDVITCLCNLEVLDLSFVGLTTLEGVVFPSLLRELNLQYNEIVSLDNVMFPNLTHLNISTYYRQHRAIKSLSRVQLPKLEYLIARGPVEDWSTTSLPDTLKELVMRVMEDPRTLKLPPNLKVLKIDFTDDLAEYSDLRLPVTLEELCLEEGISSIFDWSLPQLRSMEIRNFSGPVKVPDSVVDLCLRYKDHKLRDEIQLPPNVERLEIPYPLEEYPATVTHLRIDYCGVRSFVLPPNVESVNVAYGEFDGSSLTLPNSLISFCGPYVGDLKRPSNWDRDNEFLSVIDPDPDDPDDPDDADDADDPDDPEYPRCILIKK